jgi:hypothetical protein
MTGGWLVMLVEDDGEAASGMSTSAEVEGEAAGGLAAFGGEEVPPLIGTAWPAAAPSALTCIIEEQCVQLCVI